MAKKAKKLSKFFRIGVAGDTTDGREIQPEWLEQMAKNFNPDKYGCRINCEHIRGMAPDSSFGAFGDVVALKTEEVEIDGEKKKALFGQIEPNDDLLMLNKKRKKVYTSMEIDYDFAKTGEAYLVGLAITDSPASLSTEMLEFSAKATTNPLTDRKQRPENLFSAAAEVELEFEDNTSLVDRVKALFTEQEKDRTTADEQFTQAIEEVAGEVASLKKQLDSFTPGGSSNSEDYSKLEGKMTEMKTQLDDLVKQLGNTSNHSQRPPASGGNNQPVTDC